MLRPTRDNLRVMRALLVVAVVGCGGGPASGPTVITPPLAASGPPLPAPPPALPSVRGSAYLDVVAGHVQPAWGQFLEDCRLRLPGHHPLNRPALVATAELVVGEDGQVVQKRIVTGSGNGDFDTAVFDVLGDASPLPPPPRELQSDDQRVHVQWTFARDGRQAGAASAQVLDVQLPLLGVVERLLAANKLGRAAQRIAAAKPDDPDRIGATEKLIVFALKEGLASSDGSVRRAAVEPVARARVQALAPEVQRLVFPSVDLELQLLAIAAAATLGDPADSTTAPLLLAGLASDLATHTRLALAKAQALVTLGRRSDVNAIVRQKLGAMPDGSAATALAVLGFAPDRELAAKLPGWFTRGDARVRAGVCSALPAGAPVAAPQLIMKGLRDADAMVRATCVEAAVRAHKARSRPDAMLVRRLRELARDRDRAVRARAIGALGVLDPASRIRAIDDPAAEVRVASVSGASESELRTLAADRDPDVRAAAIGMLGDRSPELATRAATDPAPQVRTAAIAALVDDELLERLAADDSPEVATAALVKLATRRGRAAVTAPFMARLAGTPPGGRERVRIALAWLLAR